MIVVCDDDKTLTHLLSRLLEDAGYEVRVANDGQAALALTQEPKCKCMLLDMQMPNINGAELLMLLSMKNITVPVIVMTGFPDFDEEELKQFPNVKKLMKKPLNPHDVLEAIKQFTL
ncbi:MAG: response regulator [Kiritimatiellia bacterium]